MQKSVSLINLYGLETLLIEYSLGGGAIGCSAAYFLTHHQPYDRAKHRVILLEATKIAGGASGSISMPNEFHIRSHEKARALRLKV